MALIKNKNALNALYIGFLCSVSYLAVYFARNILSAVSPEMLEGGFDTEYLGQASSLYFITYAVGQLINGLIGNKVPAKIMIGSGLILAGILNLVFPLIISESPTGALVVYAVIGFFLSMIYAPMTRVVAENTDPMYTHRCSLGYTFSEFLGTPLAGIAAAFLTWQSTFFSGSAFLCIMGCIIFAVFTSFEKKGIISASPVVVKAADGKARFGVLLKRGIVKFTLISIITGVVRTSVVFWMPTYISQKLEFSAETSSLIFTVATFVIAFSTFVSVFTYERLGRSMDLTLFVMFIASSVFFILLFFVKTPIFNILFLVLAIMSSNSAASMIWARYCPGLRDTGMVSGVTGFLDFVSYLSASVSSTLFAGAVESIGWNKLILIWAGLMVFGVVISIPKRRNS